MKRFTVIALIALFVLVSLNGCLIVVSDDEASGVHWASEYDEVRERRDEHAQALLDAVRASFDADALVRDQPIFISARGSDVTLTGEASSGAALDRALQLASNVDKVGSVVSRVVVEVKN